MKRNTAFLKILIILIILLSVFWLVKNGQLLTIDKSKISNSASLNYPSEFNYRQTINDCGPYNTAAVVRILTNNKVDSADFAKNTQFRLPNKYTLPWGLEKQLKDNGLEIEIPNFKHLADIDKILFLKERLSQENPIIILGQVKNYEHYITLLGFDDNKNEFYVYDSMFDKGENGLTKDANGELPGNRNLTSEELLNFWRGGGMYGLYKWYAIIASKN